MDCQISSVYKLFLYYKAHFFILFWPSAWPEQKHTKRIKKAVIERQESVDSFYMNFLQEVLNYTGCIQYKGCVTCNCGGARMRIAIRRWRKWWRSGRRPTNVYNLLMFLAYHSLADGFFIFCCYCRFVCPFFRFHNVYMSKFTV